MTTSKTLVLFGLVCLILANTATNPIMAAVWSFAGVLNLIASWFAK